MRLRHEQQTELYNENSSNDGREEVLLMTDNVARDEVLSPLFDQQNLSDQFSFESEESISDRIVSDELFGLNPQEIHNVAYLEEDSENELECNHNQTEVYRGICNY